MFTNTFAVCLSLLAFVPFITAGLIFFSGRHQDLATLAKHSYIFLPHPASDRRVAIAAGGRGGRMVVSVEPLSRFCRPPSRITEWAAMMVTNKVLAPVPCLENILRCFASQGLRTGYRRNSENDRSRAAAKRRKE